MKKSMKIIPFLTGVFVIAILSLKSEKSIPSPKVYKFNTLIRQKSAYVYGDILDQAVKHLKNHEGFRGEVYYDVDGSPTIGYGHHLLKGEKYSNISEKKATKILITDLQTRIDYVKSNYDTLPDNQVLALSLFAFNLGIGNLKKAINRGLLEDTDKFLEYCHYHVTKNGKRIVKKSNSLLQRREFELRMYKL